MQHVKASYAKHAVKRIKINLNNVDPKIKMNVQYAVELNRNIIRIRDGKEGIIDRLLKWTVFYDTKANKLYSHTIEAVREQKPVLCGELLKELGRVTDKLLEFSNRILPYIAPRLQSLEINKHTTKTFVFRAPSPIKNSDAWLKKVKEEEKLIPKFDAAKAMKPKEEVEEIEYEDLDYELDQNETNRNQIN
jgi:hypothetical protein